MSFMNPRRLTPSMSLLLAFDAAARHLNFTRAATELSLTQSAVSRHVLALEELLEVPLFKREGRNIVLTDIGRMYHTEVSAGLQRVRNASLQAISYRAGVGSFHLAALPTFTAKWLLPRLNKFYSRHPGTVVHLHSRIGRFDVELAGVDAVIGVGDGTWPGMVAHHICNEVVVPVIGPELAAQFPCEKPKDLTKHLLLQVAARPDNWRRWFEANELPQTSMRLGPTFELTSHLTQAVASGIGVGLIPDFLVAEELRSGVIEIATPQSMDTGAGYYLWIPEAKMRLPPIEAFVKWLQSERELELRQPT